MFKRQTNGSCICVFCNQLNSVNRPTCPHCGRKNPSLWSYSRSLRRLGSDLGFTEIVTLGCIALYLITLWSDLGNTDNKIENLELLMPSLRSLKLFGASGAYQVFKLGRWWTLLSAGWLHGSLLHIAFNLMWVRYLAPKVARAFGSGRLVIIYTVAIVIGFLLSNLVNLVQTLPSHLKNAPIAIGASGGVFGLLGALVAYGQITRNFMVRDQALTYALVTFLFGFIMPNVDNWGYFGGFLGG